MSDIRTKELVSMEPPPEPNPLRATDAEIKVSEINDAVATDIELVSDIRTNDAVSDIRTKELVSMLVPPDPNPLLTADAEIKVSDMNDDVATDIELVWSLVTNDDVLSEVKKELVWSLVTNDDVSILEPPEPNPLAAADAEINVGLT